MKLPSIDRRNFVASIIALFFSYGCKKISAKENFLPVTPSNEIPLTTELPSSSVLGQYSTTEVGNSLNIYHLPGYFSQLTYGYCDKLSYLPGDSVQFYLTGPENNAKEISLTDVNGNSVFSFTTPVFTQQIIAEKPWETGYGFAATAKVIVPLNIKSGFYIWKLGTFSEHERIPVIIKSTDPNPDLTVVFPTNTDNAYNLGGGKSLYGPTVADRCTVASFSRYYLFAADYTSDFFKWLSKQNYSANFIADIDLENYSSINQSKIVVIPGHSEYWTKQARLNIDKFVDSGKNLLVLSGNTMWWQVRYNLDKNLMICTKNKAFDPLSDTVYSTIEWSSAKLNYSTTSSIGADWRGGGYGNKLPNRWNGFKIVQEKSPLFDGTSLKNGDILKLPSYEMDGAPVVKMITPGSNEIPVIDNKKLNFNKVELLAYDFAINGAAPGLGTFIVFKKKATSGTVVNVATTSWCSSAGFGGDDKTVIETITKNMIDKSLYGQSLFSA